MRYSAILLFLLFISGCKSYSKSELVGQYNVYEYKYIEYNSARITGQLNLDVDSSFLSSSCNGIWKGTWRLVGDSIYLYHQSFTYFNIEGKDSISVQEHSGIPLALGITRQGHLHERAIFNSNGKKRIANLCYRKKEIVDKDK